MIIYLAHPAKHMDKGKTLQAALENEGYEVKNPFDQDSYARAITELWDKHPKVRTKKGVAELVVEKDLDSIDKCDTVVAYVVEPSIGTSMEIHYAYSINKAVFILSNEISPWLMYHGTVIKNVKKLLDLLRLKSCISESH